jgi:chromate transporter
MTSAAAEVVPLRTIAIDWTRIGIAGFGGPPTHLALVRRLVVERERWVNQRESEDALAACNLLPGPASTQLAIFLARRVAGPWGAVVGGLGFIVPAVVLIIVLSVVFLGESLPLWVRGLGSGARAAVAAAAVSAGASLAGPSLKRATHPGRWFFYAVLGGASAALIRRYLVLVLLGCGLLELGIVRASATRHAIAAGHRRLRFPSQQLRGAGGLGALAWVAFKVGALSYGGGFVIIPLTQGDAVHTDHWMTSSQFLDAVALTRPSQPRVNARRRGVGRHGAGAGRRAGAAVRRSSDRGAKSGGRMSEALTAEVA